MDRMGGPMGLVLAALPPEQRAERYREFAAAAMRKAQETTDPDRHAEYLAMALGWHCLAVEAERSFGNGLLAKAAELGQDKTNRGGLP